MRDGYFHFRLHSKNTFLVKVGINYEWGDAKQLVDQLGAENFVFIRDARYAETRESRRPSWEIDDVDIVWTRELVEPWERENLFRSPDRTLVDKAIFQQTRRVFLVHGRDLRARDDVTRFLTGLGLSAITWEDAIRETGRPSPYILDIVTAGMDAAQAVVVLLTPDEHGGQPRPNVLIEAGMAIARDRDRTILVQVGEIRAASDLHGILVARFDRESGRANLRTFLENAGCAVRR